MSALPTVPTRIGPLAISFVVTIGFVLILVMLIAKPVTIASEVADILKILVGTLAAKFGDVVQYHIGSSQGSKDKDDVLKSIASTPQKSGP